MDILFLMLSMPEGASSDMYVDLAEEFRDHGHNVTIMAPHTIPDKDTVVVNERGMKVVRVRAKQTQGVKNMFKKGIALALLPYYFRKAYDRFLANEKFDWIFMPTPPITLIDFVSFVKSRTHAKFYLILRDIHPQSAASIGLIKYRWMYDYLDKRARKGYAIADRIGCMSQGNIDFVARTYPQLDRSKLVILLNWQKDTGTPDTAVTDIRDKYGLSDRFLVLFGGTIGLGQRIENIISLARHYRDHEDIVFVIIGKGVQKDRLERLAAESGLENIRFINFLPRNEYLDFVRSVDMGLISINENYKVPTCPSKAVSYMALKIPIFAMINPGSDYGDMIEKAGAGYWTVGGDAIDFRKFDAIYADKNLRKTMGECGYAFYSNNLTSLNAYSTIMEQIYGGSAI